MNSLFEEDDRDEPKSDADLTLGIGSLLSIFFGVVLICGIFFGFGYSMGRRNARSTALPPATVPAQAAATAPPLPENELSGAPLKPAAPDDTSAASSDSADSTPAKASAPAKQAAPDNSAAKPSTKPPTTRVVEPAATDPSLSAVPYTHRAPLPTKPHAGISAPLAQAPGDSPIIPGHPIMVQIAAVSRQEDAEVLAGALRKRGFNPTVRPGTSDKFFHVQVGPFTDKTQADAMKQHLLADGYNAIVK
ncbi:MAG TPA: SPOR domain-containing protein [Acidobacteriaceae bacterium]|jgi:cell division septation protein DedD|nr:SPOR domain-containing protein [Acidobacteriaceae bacterium]